VRNIAVNLIQAATFYGLVSEQESDHAPGVHDPCIGGPGLAGRGRHP